MPDKPDQPSPSANGLPQDLQDAQDLPFQRRSWVVERAGWTLMGLILLAAALGVFGGGPLARVEHTSPDGRLGITVARFERANTTTRLEVRASPVRGPAVRFWLSRSLLERVRIEQIQPRPARSVLTRQGTAFEFPLDADAQEARVTFYYTIIRPGSLRGQAGLAGEPGIGFSTFAFP